MNNTFLDNLKRLKVGSKLEINNNRYKVISKDKGIKRSDELKEWTLRDINGNEYLLQLVMEKSLSLWLIAIDPLFKKPIYNKHSLVNIKKIKFI